jgi:hypothetical protein
MDLKLGIVVNETGKIVNHRSLVKVICNPFLRLLGINIATIYKKEENKLYGVKFFKTKRAKKLDFKYALEEGWKIKKARIFI